MNIRIRVTASVLFILMVILLYWFAEQPAAVGLVPPPFDKVVHALLGAGMAFMLWLILDCKVPWLNIGLVALLSGFEEWHQSFLPGRVPDFYDFLAATGAAFLCVMLLRFMRNKTSTL